MPVPSVDLMGFLCGDPVSKNKFMDELGKTH